MSIPRLKSVFSGFSGLSKQRQNLKCGLQSPAGQPLRPCTLSLMGFSYHGFSTSWTCPCVDLSAWNSTLFRPSHHYPLPANSYAFFRSQCKTASSEKSFLISYNRSCPSLYALLEPDAFSLGVLKTYNYLLIYMFDFYILYLFGVCLHH